MHALSLKQYQVAVRRLKQHFIHDLQHLSVGLTTEIACTADRVIRFSRRCRGLGMRLQEA